MARRWRQVFWVVACSLAVAGVGCSSLTGSKRAAFTQATARNPAVKILCVWQQAEGPGPNGETTRGLAGQVFFFPREGEIPVTVQGDLKIFVFDDVGTPEEQAKPLSQVDVPSYELSARLGETQFGPSYTVFAPYTRKGSYEANCAVRIRLTRPDGSVLFSDMAQVKLNGTPREKPSASNTAPLSIALRRDELDRADGTKSATIAVERDGKMQVTTQRLRHLGEEAPAPLSDDEDREARLRDYESKLKRLMESNTQR